MKRLEGRTAGRTQWRRERERERERPRENAATGSAIKKKKDGDASVCKVFAQIVCAGECVLALTVVEFSILK